MRFGISCHSILIRTADRQQDRFDNVAAGDVGRRRASAPAVRSEVEDERRSREQSVRAHHKIKHLSLIADLPKALSDH
jgi:hypothetical protein